MHLCSYSRQLAYFWKILYLSATQFSSKVTKMPEEVVRHSRSHYKVREQVYRLNTPLDEVGARRRKVTQTVAKISFDVEEDETGAEESNAFEGMISEL